MSWLRIWFRRPLTTQRSSTRSLHSFRPQVERLEDLRLLSSLAGQASLAHLARLPEPVPATLVHAPVSSNPSTVDFAVAVPPADRSAPEPPGGLSCVDVARLTADLVATLSSGNGPCFPHGPC
jgi:hypothetical protein